MGFIQMNIYIKTFGCTFNQADSQIMAGLLLEQGNKLVDEPEDADVLLINTCYVKLPTEQKVVNHIINLQEKFPYKKLIISGCMVDIDQEKLEKIAPDAGWIGSHQIGSTPYVVESILKDTPVRLTGPNSIMKVCLPKVRSNNLIHILQVCEGCNGICSYCCTRIARGKLQSYPIELLKQESEKAISEGCVEIQITAQDTAAYGKDTGSSLPELINTITTIPGNFKDRLITTCLPKKMPWPKRE